MTTRARVVAIVGPSGVGKTTLLARLIPAIAARGLRVGAVKHASHGFDADSPGKDWYRLYASGAHVVAVTAPGHTALFVRAPAPPRRPSLASVMAQLPPDLDVVLAEGFAWEPVPRIVLTRGFDAPEVEDLTGGEVLHLVRVRPRGVLLASDALVRALAATVRARARGMSLAATRHVSDA